MGKEENPSLADVEVKVDIIDPWLSNDVSFRNNSKSTTAPDLRIRCIIGNGSKTLADDVFIFESENLPSGKITLPKRYKLAAGKYDVFAWADWVDGVQHNPLGYDLTSVADITPVFKNGEYSMFHDCFNAVGEIDLSAPGGKWYESPSVEISMTHVSGQLQIVATDYAEYSQAAFPGMSPEATLSATVDYEDAIPSAFNLRDNSPIRPLDNVSFDSPLEITSLPVEEMIIAADRLLLPEAPMDFLITVTVMNEAKAIVSRVENVRVPMQRGCITVVKGNFLTNHILGGITVDTSWNGEIDIILQ